MTCHRQLRACMGVVLALLCAGIGRAQQQPQTPEAEAPQETATLRVNARTVEIAAVVRDREGNGQNGLGRDDFLLKVDGRDQAIQHFSVASDLPLTLVLIVDVSGSQRTFIGDEWRASDVFFQTMLARPQDRAALVQVDARIHTLATLTNAPSRLHLALTQLGDNPTTAVRTVLNDAVYLVSKVMLSREKGRKAIVLLTDGGDNGSRATVEQAIEEAQRWNVPVYAIDYSAWTPDGTVMSFRNLQTQHDPGADLLQKVATKTGGRVYTVSSHLPLKAIYEQIGNDLRTQYEVGFSPAAGLQPNGFHKLELRTKDKKLAVQARAGFFVQP